MTSQKLLISSSAKKTIKESATLAKELNLGLEISRIPLYKNKNLNVENTIDFLKEELENYQNRITLHAMFSDVNISSSDCLIKEISQRRCYESFEIGKAIGADTILFHTGNKGTKHYGSIKLFKNNFVTFWKEFIKNFEEAGIVAVIENVFETTPEYCYELFCQINSPNLKLALDTGHVNLYAPNTKIEEWIDKYNKNLYHLHIHNNYRTNDDHSNLEDGTIDFNTILTLIKEKGLDPTFVFEMYSEENIRKSVQIFNSIMN